MVGIDNFSPAKVLGGQYGRFTFYRPMGIAVHRVGTQIVINNIPNPIIDQQGWIDLIFIPKIQGGFQSPLPWDNIFQYNGRLSRRKERTSRKIVKHIVKAKSKLMLMV